MMICIEKNAPMKNKDLLQAFTVAAVWGLNFSFIKLGVAHLDAYVLAALRFALTAIPLVFFLPRPAVAWGWLALYGLVFGVGTWGMVTMGLRAGVAPGLAAWLLQSSAFITPLLSVVWLREKWTSSQRLGAVIALAGFAAVIFATPGHSSHQGIALVLLAAVALSVANSVVKRSGIQPAGVLGFLAWSSLFSPLPLLGLAWASSGSVALVTLPQQLHGIVLGVELTDGPL